MFIVQVVFGYAINEPQSGFFAKSDESFNQACNKNPKLPKSSTMDALSEKNSCEETSQGRFRTASKNDVFRET